MMYTVGCVVGVDTVEWSRAVREQGAASVVASGSLRSIVGVDGDGQLQVVGDEPGRLADETSGFVAALGGSEPIMVGGTPYGPEALLAVVLSAIIDVNVEATGVRPGVLAIVHDDDLDPFRSSLLTEAARLAGVATERVVLMTRSAARDVEPGGDGASGGALIALDGLSDDAPGEAGDGGGAALAAGLGAGGAVGLGVHLADGGVASAAGPAVGPAGTPLGATGPTGASMGPTGTPLGPAGPTGTPLSGAGPSGTPLEGAGPAGTPLEGAGPSGTPLDAAASEGSKIPVPKPRPRWLPAAVVGGAVAVVAVAGVVVLAQGDDPPEAAVAVTTTVEPARVATTDDTPVESTGSTEPVVATTEVTPAASGWVIAEQIGEIALNAVSCDSELGPWTITFDQTIPEGTMTGSLVLVFDEQGAGTADYTAAFVVPGEGRVDMGGNQWPARIEPSGDGYTITMDSGPATGVVSAEGGSMALPSLGTSETVTFAVRPATGECG